MKNIQEWLIGAIFSIAVLLGSWAFSSQASKLDAYATKTNEHAERISKLETILEAQVEINRRLVDILIDGRER